MLCENYGKLISNCLWMTLWKKSEKVIHELPLPVHRNREFRKSIIKFDFRIIMYRYLGTSLIYSIGKEHTCVIIEIYKFIIKKLRFYLFLEILYSLEFIIRRLRNSGNLHKNFYTSTYLIPVWNKKNYENT